MELCTSTLSFREIEKEINALTRLLIRAEIHAVLVSYGFGCRREGLDAAEDIPVATALLADFIDGSEDDGIYPFGEGDLEVRSEDGRIRFLLCHEGDVHCSGTDRRLVERVRRRWAKLYRYSYEHNGQGNWRPLAE
jgi:hypothetical protein